MKKRLVLLAGISLAIFLVSSCGSSTDSLVGTWKAITPDGSSNDLVLTLNDSTFDYRVYPTGLTGTANIQNGSSDGTYSASNGVLTTSTLGLFNSGWTTVNPPTTATYTYELKGDTFTLHFDFDTDGTVEAVAFTRQ